MVQAIVRELALRCEYFVPKTPISTIYWGGGTPSLLAMEELQSIQDAIRMYYEVLPEAEITMECNPEDLSTEKLMALLQLGVNRLSIGIQTFHDPILSFVNRAHSGQEAINAVRNAKALGFSNITIDLMYALPHSSSAILQADLEQAIALDVPHISAYCFTLEEKTVFGKWAKQDRLPPNVDDFEKAQYLQLTEFLQQSGYEQYEISNFARNQQYSRHNSAYWAGTHYLGVGPGAHSFNGTSRQWNVANNALYLRQLQQNELALETETLSAENLINEAIMTQLRTVWGLDLAQLRHLGYNLEQVKQKELQQLSHNHLAEIKEDRLYLTKEGRLLADGIIVDLMA